jgi:hypothetical protein
VALTEADELREAQLAVALVLPEFLLERDTLLEAQPLDEDVAVPVDE